MASRLSISQRRYCGNLIPSIRHAGLVSGIHVFKTAAKTWMAGTQLRQGFAGLCRAMTESKKQSGRDK